MSNDDELARLLEIRLLNDIRQIDSEINALAESKRVLQRLLMNARTRGPGRPPVKRRNSIDRVMIEAAIRHALTDKTSVKSRDLYAHALATSGDLKYSTFRSYLHRMKERGLIEQRGRGAWSLI